MSEVVYPNPPIREAVFDVRVKFDKEVGLDVFEKVFEKIKVEYPKREINDMRFLSVHLKGGNPPKTETGGGPNGLRLTSKDGLQVVQLRNDGFTFSRLRPYTKWTQFSTEARRLFELYLSVCAPAYVHRIALRYINAIEIPEKKIELKEYFNTLPVVAPNLPQDLVQFFYRAVIADGTDGTFAIINETVEDAAGKPGATVIFDIDVFQQDIKVEPNSKDFWNRIDKLKQTRTTVFQESLTEKTKALFS